MTTVAALLVSKAQNSCSSFTAELTGTKRLADHPSFRGRAEHLNQGATITLN